MLRIITSLIYEDVTRYDTLELDLIGCDSSSLTNCLDLVITKFDEFLDEGKSIILSRQDVISWISEVHPNVVAKDIFKLLLDRLEETNDVRRIKTEPMKLESCGPNKTFHITRKWNGFDGGF